NEYGQRAPSIVRIASASREARGLVLVCPGGGFVYKSMFEACPVAERFASFGYNAAVLDYRCLPYTQFDALDDVKRAVRLIRSHAKEWNVLPDKIAVLGFSAGAQVANLLAAHFDEGDRESSDPLDRVSSRPNAIVQCYGGLSLCACGDYPLLTDGYTMEERVFLSAEKHLKTGGPPYFIWHTFEDQGVDIHFPLNLVKELADRAIPFEFHVFPKGLHGLALADGGNPEMPPNPRVAEWPRLCSEWLGELGF
ncbi:MAG: alpha/beta hydrolase, partial [Treponema sp.]|nr:alpha/beta hydrolase [Treponema sp.]